MFVESTSMELKREYTKSYLKTVSAFANERSGKIVFGVADDGEIIGVVNESKLRHQIENAINDNFKPIPEFKIEVQLVENKEIIILSVFRGKAIPYLYQNKAYMRLDTSTFVADDYRIRNWFQEIYSVKFEEMEVSENEGYNFTFDDLAQEFKERTGLQDFNDGALITLGLKKDGKYTNIGRLFSDKNSYLMGVDIVKFGKDYSEFVKRKRMTNQSLISQFNSAMEMFDLYYHDYQVVYNGERIDRVRIPRNAFREALANAIVHRNYEMNGNIQIEFWDTHIKITSPGGLTPEISEAQYLAGNISLPRNTTIANIFYRLGIIETMGTGIARIKSEYVPFSQESKFKISTHHIEIELPVIDYEKKELTDSRDRMVLQLLEKGACGRNEIQEHLGTSASTVKNILSILLEQNKIERFGNGKATKYRLLELE